MFAFSGGRGGETDGASWGPAVKVSPGPVGSWGSQCSRPGFCPLGQSCRLQRGKETRRGIQPVFFGFGGVFLGF